jgi:hypothetical protein
MLCEFCGAMAAAAAAMDSLLPISCKRALKAPACLRASCNLDKAALVCISDFFGFAQILLNYIQWHNTSQIARV